MLFEVSLHFGRPGREHWRSLKKSLFVFKKDDTDERRECVTINYNEMSKNKNHGVETNIKEKDQRMYSFESESLCPVYSLKLYLSKLSLQEESFLQKPRRMAI